MDSVCLCALLAISGLPLAMLSSKQQSSVSPGELRVNLNIEPGALYGRSALQGRHARCAYRHYNSRMRFDPATVITLIATLALFVGSVIIHYEGLRGFTRWLAYDQHRPRIRIAFLICGQFVLHALEICLFALGYLVLIEFLSIGGLINVVPNGDPRLYTSGFANYFYYSSVVYTTLGMGEIVPVGPIRFLTGMESVSGLLLITWSASFTYIEMRRYWWREYGEDE